MALLESNASEMLINNWVYKTLEADTVVYIIKRFNGQYEVWDTIPETKQPDELRYAGAAGEIFD